MEHFANAVELIKVAGMGEPRGTRIRVKYACYFQCLLKALGLGDFSLGALSTNLEHLKGLQSTALEEGEVA